MKNLYPITHGKTGTDLYKKWTSMKSRCYNPNSTGYRNYGGRGITTCDEWRMDFMSFYNWANENGYKEGLTIERVDNDGKYEPSNCKWITSKEQRRNQRKSRWITVDGISKIQQEWADQIGISEVCIIQARQKGKNVEEYIAAHLLT